MASGSQNNTSFQAQKWTNLRAFTVGNTAKNVDGTSAISWTLNEILGASDSSKFYRGDKTWSDTLTSHLVINGNIEGDAAIIGNRNQWGLDMYARPFAHHETNPSSTNGGNLYYAAGNKDYYNNPRWCFAQYSYTASSTATNGHYETYRLPATAADLTDNATYEIRTSKSSAYTVDNASKLLDSAHSWTATEVYNYMTARVLKAGDTMTGQLYINYNQDVGLNQTGSLIIGSKGGENVALDGNEIMARNNGAASTLYINSEGGNVYIGSGGITSVGTIAVSAGYLKSTANGNTVQIGSQNTSFCHISNSANIPFWFNQDITMAQGKHIGQAGSQYRPFQIYIGRSATADSKALNSNNPLIEFSNTDRSQYGQIIYTDFNNQGGSDSFTFVSNQSDLRIYAPKVYNAVWNDYAETRATDITEPGRVVTENGKTMTLANERLLPGCRIISDTYGTCMGREEDTPVAVSGRVLVYPYHNRNDYPLGAAVCSSPNGTVDIMTREEIINYPERIIGTVSEIPDYEYWGAGQDGKLQIPVNNRIWIYVR